jgi:hypothetical protein
MLIDLHTKASQYKSDGLAKTEAYFNAEQNAIVTRNAELYYRKMIQGGTASSATSRSGKGFIGWFWNIQRNRYSVKRMGRKNGKNECPLLPYKEVGIILYII